MVQKYIIDKTDIHDLLTGKEIPLPQGRARAFCVEIAGKITNGDVIKAMFPNIEIEEIDDELIVAYKLDVKGTPFYRVWWNAPYKTESEK